MFKPRIAYQGKFRIAEIGIEPVDHVWRVDADYEQLVAAKWRELTALAAAENHRLWDGVHYRVANMDTLGSPNGGLTLRLGTISFRYVATYRGLQEKHKAAGLAPLHHLSIAGAIRTADGQYLFGKRTRNGAIDFIGGGVQPSELAVSTGADIERTLFKEIAEEVGIRDTDLGQPQGIGIVVSGTSNVLVIAHVETALSAKGVRETFARRAEDEMAEPVFVPAAELPAYLRGMTDYRVLVADLL